MITRRRRNVAGTTAVIDGATSGLGRATALALARHGARLALASRDAAALSEVAEECRRLGAEAFVIPTDVSDAGDVAALGQRAVETLGSVDAWINAAGVLVAGQLDATPVEAIHRLIAVNVRGTLLSLEVAYEESQSASEELETTNEELQSTSSIRRTKSCSRRTKSSRRRTKSCRRPTKSCTRSTTSCATARTRSTSSTPISSRSSPG